MLVADRLLAPAAIRVDLGAIFVSMELSKSTWVLTSLLPVRASVCRSMRFVLVT